MTIKAGDKMPEGTFTRMTPDGPQKVTTDQLFSGKTVVFFSVPGAFTPTCDAKHLPGFVELADQIKAKGVDTIACTAVNDAFVMPHTPRPSDWRWTRRNSVWASEANGLPLSSKMGLPLT
jgi:peroxiredoxin